MNYYEVWFYFYGDGDLRTKLEKEYTFYMKTEKKIESRDELISELKKGFPKTEKYNVEGVNYIPNEDYDYLSNWFEIDAEEFTNGCGIKA